MGKVIAVADHIYNYMEVVIENDIKEAERKVERYHRDGKPKDEETWASILKWKKENLEAIRKGTLDVPY